MDEGDHMTNYEEACRRVSVLTERIAAAIAHGEVSKEQGETAVNHYRVELLSLQEQYLLPDGESELTKELHAPYVGETSVREDTSVFTLGYVAGLIGIGPECAIPEELRVVKPD
jgi:hypothetical protein